MVLMVAAPPVEANCVRPPEPKLIVMLPSVWPLTITFGTEIAEPVGLTNAPLAPKVKVVPMLTQPTWVPVAAGLV